MNESRPNQHWRSLEDRDGRTVDPDPNGAIREALALPVEDLSASRRSFLKLVGFGVGAAALQSCSRGPVTKAIPYLIAPEEIVPGRAYWMATTCGGCAAGCGVLARCRDGRPVKLEGNPAHPLSQGGLCAAGQGSLLELYDSHRLAAPTVAGQEATFAAADEAVREGLARARADGRAVRVLTGTLHGPSTRAWLQRFLEAVPEARHVSYDALSTAAVAMAHERTHGVRRRPRYRFDQARVIAAFDADFLGTGTSPVEHGLGWAQGRRPDAVPASMSRHFQFESRLSLTGTRADVRAAVAPHEMGALLGHLCRGLALRSGASLELPPADPAVPAPAALEQATEELWQARGHALVVCGVNAPGLQELVNVANHLLDAYGATVDLDRPSAQATGDDAALAALRQELAEQKVGVLVIAGCNPVHDLPDPAGLVASLAQVPLVVSLASHLDETAEHAAVVLPAAHFLEAWDDGEPVHGTLTVSQPTVPALRPGRTLRECLARWMGDEREDRALLEDHWRELVYPQVAAGGGFAAFFRQACHEGFVELTRPAAGPAPAFRATAGAAARATQAPAPGTFALVLYSKVGVRDGRHALNPWLQELPDPVSKVTWDNYACLAPSTARTLGLEQGDVVRLSLVGEASAEPVELPVQIQPGQHPGVVAVALGYGRKGTERFALAGPQWLQGRPTVAEGQRVGRNAAHLVQVQGGVLRYDRGEVRIEALGRRHRLACTQDHHTLKVPEHLAPRGGEVRDAVLSTTFAAYAADPSHALPHGHPAGPDLWPEDHKTDGPRWGMAIDLSRCTGCSACVVGCQAENNVPVVGKDEVLRHREMHWLRIDRYYAGDEDQVTTVHQPMMCQHCDHAPCETVCPVLATVHSKEGLNQQVYNRCVGTRYCANNCPYKVRRFNWFDYPHEDRLQNLSLNPDVTIRSRGVMEKCSFCVQRIVDARAEARRAGRPLADGDVKTACQQSCPARAITFGDLDDPDSAVSREARRARAYRVLAELNVQPSVVYQAEVMNRDPKESDAHVQH